MPRAAAAAVWLGQMTNEPSACTWPTDRPGRPRRGCGGSGVCRRGRSRIGWQGLGQYADGSVCRFWVRVASPSSCVSAGRSKRCTKPPAKRRVDLVFQPPNRLPLRCLAHSPGLQVKNRALAVNQTENPVFRWPTWIRSARHRMPPNRCTVSLDERTGKGCNPLDLLLRFDVRRPALRLSRRAAHSCRCSVAVRLAVVLISAFTRRVGRPPPDAGAPPDAGRRTGRPTAPTARRPIAAPPAAPAGRPDRPTTRPLPTGRPPPRRPPPRRPIATPPPGPPARPPAVAAPRCPAPDAGHLRPTRLNPVCQIQ